MVIGWYPPGGYLSRFSTSSMGIYSPVSPVAVKEPKRASVQLCGVAAVEDGLREIQFGQAIKYTS
jgi:hypothetical protein